MRVHTICLLVPALGIAMTGPIPILAQRVQAQGAAGNKMVLPANPAEEDIVPVELAREIAAFEAQTMFGPGALSQPMVGRDLNGCTRAYIFVVARGMAAFPTDSTIMARLRDARAATPAARQAVARAREAALSAQLDVEVEGTGGRGKIRRSADWDAAEDLLQEQLEGSWGTRDYGTVIVSGRKDLVPVLSCGTGLPPHFVWLDHAAQLARDSLGTPSVSLRCLWFAGPMDQILEFVSTSGEVAWVVLFPPSLARPGSVTPRLLESTVTSHHHDPGFLTVLTQAP